MKPTSPAPAATTLRPGQFFGGVDVCRKTALVTLSVVAHDRPREVPTHSHAHMYLSLLLRGGYQEWVGEQQLVYQPLTAVFHPELLVHRDEITLPGSRFFIVEADPSIVGDRERRHRGLASVRDLSGGPVVWSLLRLHDTVRRAHDALDGEEPVVEILDELLGSPAPPVARPAWLKRVEAHLRDGFRASMTLRALADTAGVHPTHAMRAFRRHHGCTMRTFLHRLRVLEASRRIAGGSPLAEAALASGFCDQAHLTRVFRAVTGLTPSGYRAMVRQEGRSTAAANVLPKTASRP